MLKQLLKGLKEMEQDLKEAIDKDLGRDSFVSWFVELEPTKLDAKHALQHVRDWSKEEVVDTPLFAGPGRSKIIYEPLGVALIISSWNYPILTALHPLIAAIASGNCAIIKPSEMAPYSSKALKKLVTQYLDNGCYQVIEGAIEVAKSLTSKKFDVIVFTGSPEKGKLVQKAASENLVPCILELGGKSPCVVDESADLDLAAKKIVFSRFTNSGQTCIAPDFVLVQEKVRQAFCDKLVSYVQKFYG